MRKYVLYLLGALAAGIIGFLFVLLFTKSSFKISEDYIIAGYSEDVGGMVFFQYATFELSEADGPYVIGDSIVRVLPKGVIEKVAFRQNQSIVVRPVAPSLPEFAVKPSIRSSPVLAEAELPKKLLAVSDVEGNLVAFVSLLQAQGVIDGQLNWTFGANELITLGDFVSRGNDVAAVLWLIQKLEQEAAAQGGRVTFLLGDQEYLQLSANWESIHSKYKAIAMDLVKSDNRMLSYEAFFNQKTHFGNWLRSRPSLVRRGEYLFVHGGVHPDIADLGMNLLAINEAISQNLSVQLSRQLEPNSVINFLMGETGPLSYRGLIEHYHGENKLESRELNRILNGFDAARVVIGHTLVDEISTDYTGRVIRIKVAEGVAATSAKTQGLLVEDGRPYRVDAAKGKFPLE